MAKKTNKNNRKYLAILALILVLGLVFRLYSITRQNFWIDEAISIHDARFSNFPQFIESLSENEPVAPFYFLVLHYWLNLGLSEFSTRLLSVIFSLVSILFVYLCVSKISNEKIALVSSFIFAVSFVEIVFAQEVRYYSLFTMLCLISTYFFIIINYGKPRKLFLFLYFLSSLLALYTGYFALFLFLLHFCFFLFSKKSARNIFSFLVVYLAIFISFLPWLPILFHQFLKWQQLTMDIYSLNGIPPPIANLGLFLLMIPIALILTALLMLSLLNKKKNLFIRAKRYNDNHPILLLTLILLFYILLFPFLVQSKVIIRYFLFLTPVSYFLLARQIFLFKRKAIVAIILILLLTAGLFVYYNKTTKAEWTQAIAFMSDLKDGNNTILVLDEGMNSWVLNLYYNGSMAVLPLWQDQSLSTAEFQSQLSGKKYAWLALSRNWRRGDYYKNLMDSLFGMPKVQKSFYDIRLYLYEIPNS